MLLRSSSTPALGSLFSPIQEGSNNNHETNTTFKHHLPPPSPTTTTTIHHSHSYNKLWNVGYEGERGLVGQKMYLAKGLGIGGRGGGRGGFGGGGGGEFNSAGSSGDSRGSQGIEEYYKKMVEENPGNPLFLSNYAQYLYQSKQDLLKAEEYYSRTILADSGDGEIRTSNVLFFSHVHASYAGFLWETQEDDDECDAPSDFNSIATQFGRPVVASANANL